MRDLYTVALVLTAVVLLLVIINSSTKKMNYIIQLRFAFMAALVATFANLIMIQDNARVMTLGASLFYTSVDFMLISLMEYSLSYAGLRRKYRRQRRILAITIGCIDGVSLLATNIWEHAFTVKEVYSRSGEHYYQTVGRLPYYVHISYCYFLVAIVLVTLIYKGIVSPSYYRKKYFMIIFVLAVAVSIDGIYVVYGSEIGLGVLTYAIASVLIYYYTAFYAPKELIHTTLHSLVEELVDALFVFDIDDRVIYVNESGMKIVGEGGNDDAEVYLKEFRRFYPEEKYGTFIIDQEVARNGQNYNLHITYQQIVDRKGRYTGCSVRLQNQTEEIKRLQREYYEASHDNLTGIFNKEYFLSQCRHTLDDNPEEEYLIIVSDIENFKLINDVFGIDTGNDILKMIANAIAERIKPGDIYGRLEGDKFGIMMPKNRFREEYFIRETDLKVDIAQLSNFPLNIYLGVYEILERNIEISAMVDRSLLAIRSIKGALDKRLAYYDDAIRKNMLEERQLVNELNPALANKEFVLFLQPQVDNDGKVQGAEALVRWQHPTRGLLFPNSFIDLFEKRGVITRLDEYVWEAACEKLAEWKSRGYDDRYISVNISARDMYSLNIFYVFTTLVKKYEISPQNLHLEITETAVMMNLEQQIELLQRLRNFGFEVEMDDFGSGYSSLNMLKNIDIDVLKIDMKFLGRADDMLKGRKILTSVIEMAKALNLECIMEGVETEEELSFLKEIGCSMYQGYYFDKPIPIEAFEEKYL